MARAVSATVSAPRLDRTNASVRTSAQYQVSQQIRRLSGGRAPHRSPALAPQIREGRLPEARRW
ncbi:hypothetical protein [Nonomuraea dietziae]|uniref:hypothetical protein n=1 Tax=Nonomuraea dietziae TaxID=65515 RepID=UPI0031DDFABB